jgi:hypothetical protein
MPDQAPNGAACTFNLLNGATVKVSFNDSPFPNPQDPSFTETTYTYGIDGGTGLVDVDLFDPKAQQDGDWCGSSDGSGIIEVVSAAHQDAAPQDHVTAGFTVSCPDTGKSVTGCVTATE